MSPRQPAAALKSARKPRQRRTLAERATEALGVADRRVEFLSGRKKTLTSELAGVEAELAEAINRQGFLRNGPALPRTVVTDSASGGTVAAGGAS